MKRIDRVSLYQRIQRLLNERDDELYDLFFKQFDDSFMRSLLSLLKLNINILIGIEENFLINSSNKKFDKNKFKKIYIENLNRDTLKDDFINESHIRKLKIFAEDIDKLTNEFYIFNSLINLLCDINNTTIKKFKINENINNVLIFCEGNKNKVFLSHAFDDKLYTLALFIYMLKEDIFLYVDWIFSPKLTNGICIKCNLSHNLLNSNQLLFLRTVNSELSIRGSGNIRGWCSWELGTFYAINRMRSNNKYYIELYGSKNNLLNNKQLHGIRPLRDIVQGKLR